MQWNPHIETLNDRVRKTSRSMCRDGDAHGEDQRSPSIPYPMHSLELTCATNRKCRNNGVWLPGLGHSQQGFCLALWDHIHHVMRTSKQPSGQIYLRPPSNNQHLTEPPGKWVFKASQDDCNPNPPRGGRGHRVRATQLRCSETVWDNIYCLCVCVCCLLTFCIILRILSTTTIITAFTERT